MSVVMHIIFLRMCSLLKAPYRPKFHNEKKKHFTTLNGEVSAASDVNFSVHSLTQASGCLPVKLLVARLTN